MSAGDVGLEESREARKGVMELGDEMEDGTVGEGIGTGVRESSMIGSMGSDKIISRYLSHS